MLKRLNSHKRRDTSQTSMRRAVKYRDAVNSLAKTKVG